MLGVLPPSPPSPVPLSTSCFWVCVSGLQNSLCVHQKNPPHVSVHSPSALQPDSNYLQTPLNLTVATETPDPCHVGAGGLKIAFQRLGRTESDWLPQTVVMSPPPTSKYGCDVIFEASALSSVAVKISRNRTRGSPVVLVSFPCRSPPSSSSSSPSVPMCSEA